MIRFKTDENLPREISDLLVQAGHDSIRADEQGLCGAKDDAIAAISRSEERVIVTLDADFMDIRRYPPELYSGIVVLRPRRQSVRQMEKMAARLIPLFESEPIAKKLWIVDEVRIRIRPDETA